jgi:hypothetical protein
VIRRALATALAAAAVLAVPSAAEAARGQLTMMEDSTQVLSEGPAARDFALDQFKAMGAEIVKVRVEWRDMAPDPASRRKPDFDATDPDAYPAGVWDALDAAVRGIVARGMKPFLMLSPPSPDWATEAPPKKYVGVWKSDPAEYGRFVRALGRRYAGNPGGLPRVSMWSIWNEPNHPQFIQPLSERVAGKMIPSSPHQYRRLYVAATDALTASGHGTDKVLFGEVLPIGQRRLGTLNTMRPLLWLREFFCVDGRYRPYRGGAARARGCDNFPQIRTSGFAMHPYTKPAGPRFVLASPDDATIGQIGRVEKALDRIAKTGRAPRRLAVYSTEFGLQSDPPDCIGFGVPLARQAEVLNEGEYDSFVHRRVKTYSQYLLIDDPVLPQFAPGSNERYGRFQTGLMYGENAVRCESPGIRFRVGQPKQPTFDAFRTPIWVRKLSFGRGVQVFGRARPRGRAPQQIRILHRGRTVKTVTASGYFLTSLRGSSAGTWQLQWSFGTRAQTFRSRLARALPDPPARSR